MKCVKKVVRPRIAHLDGPEQLRPVELAAAVLVQLPEHLDARRPDLRLDLSAARGQLRQLLLVHRLAARLLGFQASLLVEPQRKRLLEGAVLGELARLCTTTGV